MSEKLNGKRALVTAGAQGIGLAISRALLDAGCSVAVHYFSSADAANELKSEFGDRVVALQADLTDPAKTKEMVEQAVKGLGGLDVLINNAGSLIGRRKLDEIEPDFWQTVIDVNMTSMINVTKFAAPALREAKGAKGGHAGSLAYSTAKGAVLTMTRAMSNELGPDLIRVNALAPGLILETSFHNTHTTKESAAKTISGIPIKRAGTPADVAHATIFLAEQYDGFVTGATLDINGGVYSA